jgi:gliding motility-associated-like protein
VKFTGPASTGSYTIGQWEWTYPDGSIDSVQNPVKLLAATGTQNVQLQVVTTDGCVADVTKPITVYAPPVTTLSATPLAVCEGGSITFSETSSYGGPVPINSWYWDYGNGTTVTTANGNAQTVLYPAYGTYTAKHVVKVSNTCVSDTAVAPVTVYAKPQPGFSYPAGCLPENGIVQFTDTSKAPDGQTITGWSWNFGDPNATSGNPNTATQQNPSHTYSFGTYTIQFSVTTANGCTKDTTVTATFSLRPRLNYPALPAYCASVTNPVSVATATVTNGVPGAGVYSGPGTTAAGSFTPSIAGAGTHTITYTFTTTGGCTETITSTVTVYPKPTASFTANSDICLNQAATIDDQSTIASGTITSYNWNFGDGNWVPYNNSDAFTHTWSAYSTYSVKLVAVSDQGCTSDTVTRSVTVHPLPATDFSLPAAVCMPGGSANFQNATTVADQSALSYTWDFGDNSMVSHAINASHVYAASGSYVIQLQATSAWGCTSSATKTLQSFFDKPVAAFTVSPDTLCQGSDNEFSDESTSNNSTINKWSWNFGDGSTDSEKDPVKRYQLPGNYTVTLEVTNSAGCTSQPFTKQVVVYLQPVIDAGPSFTVPQGTVVQFNPTANDSTVLSFSWTPGTGLSNANTLRPSLVAMNDETYTLTAMGEGQCTASDFLKVKILKPVSVPNAFSPNGDGIHDTWNITNLSDYPGCTVEVFNRYGQRMFYSAGYTTPWNGTAGGKPLPMATYYYVIHLKNGFEPRTGSVTIIK